MTHTRGRDQYGRQCETSAANAFDEATVHRTSPKGRSVLQWLRDRKRAQKADVMGRICAIDGNVVTLEIAVPVGGELISGKIFIRRYSNTWLLTSQQGRPESASYCLEFP